MPKSFQIAKRPPKANQRMKLIRGIADQKIDKVMDRHLQVRRRITYTWKHYAPEFQKKRLATRNNMTEYRIFYIVDDRVKGKKAKISVYRLLNNGTRVRYAVLSPDWVNKTAVKSLSSSFGKGRVLLISKQYEFEGIKARGWEKTDKDDGLVNPLLQDEMYTSIIRGYRDGFKAVQGRS